MSGKRSSSSKDSASTEHGKKARAATTEAGEENPPTYVLKVSEEDNGFGKALRILVFNYKGGCGKTSIVSNLGGALAWSGLKVLSIDGDAQCNLTSFFKSDSNASIISEADYAEIVGGSVLEHLRDSEGKILSDDLADDVHASAMRAYIRYLTVYVLLLL